MFDPELILAALERHGVAYVVIGGYAAQLHGASRPTVDIDVTPERSLDNLGRLTAALEELGAHIRVAGIDGGLPFRTSAEDLATMSLLNLDTAHGDLDISMVPNGTDGYADLIRAASSVRVGRLQVAVASLEDVVRSKEAANRPKDLAALPELYRLLSQRKD